MLPPLRGARRGALFLGLISGFAATPALASGGFGCEVEDRQVKLLVEGGITHGMGAPFFNVRGTLELKRAKVPEDLRHVVFEQAHLSQNWLDGKDFRLRLYRERDNDQPHAYVEIGIVTKAKDEADYAGSYEIAVFDGEAGEGGSVKLRGKVNCSVE